MAARRALCQQREFLKAVEVAKACSNFQGIFYWPSWLDEAGFKAACLKIDSAIDALSASGFEAKIVSGGSTPGASQTPLIPGTTEIRPGTYVFYDTSSIEAKACVEADCALRVLTTVVRTSVPRAMRDRRRFKNALE